LLKNIGVTIAQSVETPAVPACSTPTDGSTTMNGQWGTFTRRGSVHDLLAEAEQAMHAQGYQVFNSLANRNSMIIGGRGDVLVQATSMSAGQGETFNIVSAFSEDPGAAEQARNSIRDAMRDVVIIDNGVVGVPAQV
jgi:hypothetical protein